MTQRSRSSRSKKPHGRLLLPCTVAIVSAASATFLAVAQEPRFRLRDIPQRIVKRVNPDAAQQRNRLQNVPPSDPSQANKKPADSGKEATENAESTEAMESQGGADRETISLANPNNLAAPDEAAPLVVATEAEKHQKIADGWPKPWACFYITGRQHGYIEPCGCTGLENQKGGLSRRDTLLTQLKDRGWTMVPVDSGDWVRRQGKQQEIKYKHTSEVLQMMGYAGVGFGPEELKLGSTDLYLQMTNLKGEQKSQFVSSNVSILTEGVPERFKVSVLPSGRRIGITSVLGDDFAKDVPTGEITVDAAVTALKPIADQLVQQKCDYLVLVANGSLEETRRIAEAVPVFDLVVTAGGHGEPLYKPEPISNTKSIMVQVGVKGMYAGILGLYDDQKEPFRYQRIALSSQFEDSARVLEAFGKYQESLKKLGFKGLGLTPLTHPSQRQYVGSEKCGECHTTAYETWKNTPHFHATESIVHPPERGEIARNFDPECVSCHVTGWNPQGFYPYKTGYTSLEASAHLTGNGCENCHGPGSEHVAFESGDIQGDDEMRKKLIEEMRLPLERAADKCLECHDMDNSPEFHKEKAFDKYWQKVAHYGKD